MRHDNRGFICKPIGVNDVQVSSTSSTTSCVTTPFAPSALIPVNLPHPSAIQLINGDNIFCPKQIEDFPVHLSLLSERPILI